MLWLNSINFISWLFQLPSPSAKNGSVTFPRRNPLAPDFPPKVGVKRWVGAVWEQMVCVNQPVLPRTDRPTIRNSCANFFWHKCKYKQVQRHAKTKIETKNMQIHLTNQLQLANGSKASGQDGGCSQFYAAPASFSFWELVYALELFFLFIRTLVSLFRTLFWHLQFFSRKLVGPISLLKTHFPCV